MLELPILARLIESIKNLNGYLVEKLWKKKWTFGTWENLQLLNFNQAKPLFMQVNCISLKVLIN